MKDKKLRFFGLNKLLPFLRPYRTMFVLMAAGAVAVGGLFSMLPLFQKYAIDVFIGQKTLNGFAWFLVAYCANLLLTLIADYIACYNCCKIEMFVLRDMRTRAFDHLQTLSVAFFNVNGVGRIHSRVMSDTSVISSVLSWNIYSGVWNGVYAVGAVGVMFALDPVLALCVVAVVPVVALCSAWFQKRLTAVNRRIRETNSRLTGELNEGIIGAETSKTLRVEETLERGFFTTARLLRKESTRRGHLRALFLSLISLASYVALAAVLWYGGIVTSKDVLALLGTLTVFMNYAQGLMGPVQWTVDVIADLISVKVNVERFSGLLETESDVKDTPEVTETYGDVFCPKKENWEPLLGEVDFEDVTFRYPDGEELVLEHFSLHVPRGSNVAIVGETGAGKSTLVGLVCRFYEPTEGRVLIDGRDVRERSVSWLHANIGYVLQTPHLFSGSVRENIRFGKEDATDEEIMRALESVNAAQIVEKLGGLDAQLGEDGSTLSTGEKQLLSFARAIVSDPAIFILDEATASVDTLTEQRIQGAIEALMKGRTSFCIAHRLSTIRRADVILVVHEGKIVERGTHEELYRLGGRYHDLYIRQYREEKSR